MQEQLAQDRRAGGRQQGAASAGNLGGGSATKQETIEENVNEIKADVKSLKALPGSRWEAVVKGVIAALVAGLIGFALAKLGVGG